MKKIIVTTTINAPTEAIRKYDAMEDWKLLVVMDRQTPIDYKLDRGEVIRTDYILAKYRELVNLIGWNSVRLGRMVAFIEAYKLGADILASIDDDCIPDDNWGKDVVLGEEIEAREYVGHDLCFDPFIDGSFINIRHRGYPLELESRSLGGWKTAKIVPLVREDHCNGDSDYNAIDRLTDFIEYYESNNPTPYFADCFSPINTQNTFIHRSAIKDFYANIPFIGRADDIWAGYIFQALHPRSTVYGSPSATHEQERSVQSLVNDLEVEIFMYRNTLGFLKAINRFGLERAMKAYLPEKSIQAINLYRSYFND